MEDKSKGTRQKGKLDLKTKQKKMREAERCLWRGKGEIYNNFKVFQGRLQSERTNKTYFTSQQKKNLSTISSFRVVLHIRRRL